MEASKQTRDIKTEMSPIKTSSSPNSTNLATNIKVLKSTSNLKSSAPNNPIIISNTSSAVLINQKSPQVSYRLINLNTQNSAHSPTSASSASQLVLMMPNNNQNVTFVKKGDQFQKSVLDQKRRLTHKEIERRRRDKINDWIYALSREVPDCAADRTKQGQSKGGILAKTVKYIQEIRTQNYKINKEKEDLKQELEKLKQQIEQLEEDKNHLRTSLALGDIKLHSKKK